jgi:hypothetical protein
MTEAGLPTNAAASSPLIVLEVEPGAGQDLGAVQRIDCLRMSRPGGGEKDGGADAPDG